VIDVHTSNATRLKSDCKERSLTDYGLVLGVSYRIRRRLKHSRRSNGWENDEDCHVDEKVENAKVQKSKRENARPMTNDNMSSVALDDKQQ